MNPLARSIAALAGAAVLAAAGAGLYALGQRHGERVASAPVGPASAASAPRRVLYWHDPMVPGTKFDKPGKSPFMDMDLVPVYADADADAGIAIGARVQQNLGVRTAIVERAALAPAVEATGSVGWNERDSAVVAARAAGWVERLRVRAAYDPVARGQPIADLYVPDWVAAQEEFLALRRMHGDDLGALVDGARTRMRQAGMTEAQIAAVEAAGRVQPRVAVVAPIDGVLAELPLREGAAVTPGMPIARIAGIASVWVNAQLPEALAAQVRPGGDVEATTPAGDRLRGRVAALLPEVDAATRTVKVRVELPNPSRTLLPGMSASLRFAAPAREALVVPTEALITTGRRSIVMLAEDDGRFRPVEVEPGIEAGGRTEIRRGLEAGQRVVRSGQFLLDSEASLKGLEARLAPEPEGEPAAASAAPGAHAGHGAPDVAPAHEGHDAHGHRP